MHVSGTPTGIVSRFSLVSYHGELMHCMLECTHTSTVTKFAAISMLPARHAFVESGLAVLNREMYLDNFNQARLECGDAWHKNTKMLKGVQTRKRNSACDI